MLRSITLTRFFLRNHLDAHLCSFLCPPPAAYLQAEKLWLGYLQQSELSGSMVLATFWAICEAVSQGDVQAAEFADMTVEEYVSYGTAEARADFRNFCI